MIRLSCFADEIAPGLADQIRVLRELGLRFLEIRTVDDVNVMELSPKTLRTVRRTCDGSGLTITCVSSPIGKERADLTLDRAVAQVEHAADIADVFGCRHIRVFSFFRRELPEKEAYRMSLEKLRAMAAVAEIRGKVLVMESGADTVGARSADMLRLLQEIDSPALKCAFDPAAFFAAGDEPFEESLPTLEEHIAYVHIKDIRGGHPRRVPAGEGDARIREIVSALKDRDLTFSLEPHLSYAGERRGFSGEDGFKRAHTAFVTILKELNVAYE